MSSTTATPTATPPGPADVYEAHFVPALFAQWPARVLDTAAVGPGDRVLDVACGTGVLAHAAAERVGAEGAVTGLDPNPEMLAVAQRRPCAVDWRAGRAEALPFDDASYDAVVSQFGMMFFDDPAGALREMARVLRPGRRLAVAVCAAVDRSPGYSVLAELLHRLFGHDVAEAFRAPFALGDARQLADIAACAGLHDASIAALDGQVRFDSIDALVATERACAWTLGGLLDDAQFARLRAAAQDSLRPFSTTGGAVRFSMPALVLTAEHA